MRSSAFVLVSVLLLVAHPVQAAPDAPARPKAATIKLPASATEIVIDKAKSVIRFMVDGKEVATISKDGLLVDGDVSYSGGLTDTIEKGGKAQ